MADESDRLLRGDQHITLAFGEERKEQLKCEAPESETDARALQDCFLSRTEETVSAHI